ncbi:hypothetical protein [Candidatus Protochlamydia phocaeensis]|uniref:hypothetical protein n=1 Tax=Candidatus Protochlamydia phocaeensis TaxID=1414722 RepID=UPI0008394F36|nr:hypothetical protein [Candidatus Protochlamydia phocaeensis]
MNLPISHLIPPPKDPLDSSSSGVKGKWVYTNKQVFYSTSHKPISGQGKKIEVSLQKVKKLLQEVDPLSLKEGDIESLSALKALVGVKVEKYNQSHGRIYKFFSRLIYGDVNAYKNQIIKSVDSLLERNALEKEASSKISEAEKDASKIAEEVVKSPIEKEELPPLSSSLQTPEKAEFKSLYQEFAPQFVKDFLLPYITGKIRPETESKDRLPMMDRLLSELERQKQAPLSINERKDIEQLALDTYLHVAIGGLYAHLNRNHSQKPIEIYAYGKEFTKEFQMLLDSLKPSLIKDFPAQNITDQYLEEIVKKALVKFNQDVEVDTAIGNPDDRFIKAKEILSEENITKLRQLYKQYAENLEELILLEEKTPRARIAYEEAKKSKNLFLNSKENRLEYERLYSKIKNNYFNLLSKKQESLENLNKIKEEINKIESKKLFLDPKQSEQEIKTIADAELAKAQEYKSKRLKKNAELGE